MCICSTFDFERGCGGRVELQDIHCGTPVSTLESSSEAALVSLGDCRLLQQLAAKSLEQLSMDKQSWRVCGSVNNILLLNKDGNYNPFTNNWISGLCIIGSLALCS